ncbi:hypothetical protein QBC46DRAFT_392319 [Diplogelasinospora grovesii]|uniref:Uncharacterized protein n=1 Tax=Diplogelasinospora grovesii TaxID=303347 RepID=A0AAN6N1V2_9PEZI|nr:hypothetical protein QBC46DRAFT_392319 [Diplogelasinospora grovesii]
MMGGAAGHMQRPGMVPPPPQNIVPAVLQEDLPVTISDIRKERLTPAEAREELSEFYVYTLEKINEGNDCDSDGDRKKTTWANVRITPVRNLSTKEAAHQVREINRTTIPISAKKATLSSSQQMQLDRILEALRCSDSQFYQTNLVQMHHKLVDKVVAVDQGVRAITHHKNHKDARGLLFRERNVRDKRHHGWSSKSKDWKPQHKTVKECVSITAYFKRSPKPEADAIALFHQREAEIQRGMRPPNPHITLGPEIPYPNMYQNMHQPMHQNMHQNVHQQMHPDVQRPSQHMPQPTAFPQDRPNASFASRGSTPTARFEQSVKQPFKQSENNNRKPPPSPRRSQSPGPPRRSPHPPQRARSPSSSSSSRSDFSYTSRTDKDDSSTMSPNTTSSSSDASSDHVHTRPRKGGIVLEGLNPCGLKNQAKYKATPHNNNNHNIGDRRMPGHFQNRPEYLPRKPVASTMPVDIEQITTNAYAAGRAAAQIETQEMAEKIAYASARAAAAGAAAGRPMGPGSGVGAGAAGAGRLPPRIIQGRTNGGVRTVLPVDVTGILHDKEDLLDRHMDNLHLGDDDDDLFLDDHIPPYPPSPSPYATRRRPLVADDWDRDRDARYPRRRMEDPRDRNVWDDDEEDIFVIPERSTRRAPPRDYGHADMPSRRPFMKVRPFASRPGLNIGTRREHRSYL